MFTQFYFQLWPYVTFNQQHFFQIYSLIDEWLQIHFTATPELFLYQNILDPALFQAQWTKWTIPFSLAVLKNNGVKKKNITSFHMAEIWEDGAVHIFLCSTYLRQTHNQKSRGRVELYRTSTRKGYLKKFHGMDHS